MDRLVRRQGPAPLAARFTHINAYARHLEADGGLAARTVARALSSISSW